MDIDHPALPFVDEPGRQHTHEPGQSDDLGARADKGSVHRAFEGFAVFAEGLVVNCDRLHAGRARGFEATGIGPVGEDEDGLCRVVRRGGGLQ